MKSFFWQRLFAVVSKEFKQMSRDSVTFGMMIGIPLIQLILFGFAIDLNPRHLPTVVVMQQTDPITRDILQRMQQSRYFDMQPSNLSLAEAKQLLKTNQVKFVVYFPPHFFRDVVRGFKPQVLLLADGSDPIASGRAISVFNEISYLVGKDKLRFFHFEDNRVYRPLALSAFNPSINTAFHIVPALMAKPIF